MFINENYLKELLQAGKAATPAQVATILQKAARLEGLTPQEVAALLAVKDEGQLSEIFAMALSIKEQVYGNRIVIFAPLYVSNYCDNHCTYCGFNAKRRFQRSRLTQAELVAEVKVLQQMGHKRIALEAGESVAHCSIDYLLECMATIYQHGIRRINVNIGATSVEAYARLKQAEVGTYILFQETYHQPTYEKVHLAGKKADYVYHTLALDRAMQGGLDDVGGGVLFGLADCDFEVLGLMLHNEHLQKQYGVGFHTVSVPRLRPITGMELADFPNLVSDATFKKLVAIMRLALPFTGIILSTRENQVMRKALLALGVSQLSAGSNTEVGGYTNSKVSNPQFVVSDERSAVNTIAELMADGYLPSFCTACYRDGRTGDRFMQLAKAGQIKNVCLPNALMTLCEYGAEFGDAPFNQQIAQLINSQLPNIENEKIRHLTSTNLKKLKAGKRDLFL